jgi:purine-nucleoside phosphorylase
MPRTSSQIGDAAAAVARLGGPPPAAAIVLGSGLGGVAGRVAGAVETPYADLPHWPAPTVGGHAGRRVLGALAGRRVAVLAGRVHLYEGHDASTVAFAVRVMARLGVRHLVLTNAAGGVDPALTPGTLMVVDDHFNLQGATPLPGPDDTGPGFHDMSEVYTRRLRDAADEAARAAGLRVAHGVYAGVRGPAYETPAEVRALRALGADAVGMSTVQEAIAARALGLEVAAVACIANHAAGVTGAPLDHDDVLGTMQRTDAALADLLTGLIERL